MINIKKTAVAVFTMVGVASVMNTVQAGIYVTPDTPFDDLPAPQFVDPSTQTKQGLYVGIGAGALYFNNKLNVSGNATVDNTAVSNSVEPANGNATGAMGTLMVGYSWTFPSRFFLGIEGFGDLTNTDIQQTATAAKQNTSTISTTITGSDDLTMQYVYGARVLPGFEMTSNSVLYGIVGYARGHASLSGGTATATVLNSANGHTVTADVGDLSKTSSSYNYNGIELGLGTLINFTDHLGMRVDLIYTGYGQQTLASSSKTSPDGTAFASISTTSTPYTFEGDLSLVYTF